MSNPASVGEAGNLVSKIDCLQVGVSPGQAQLTALVTHSTGTFAVFREGSEIQVDLFVPECQGTGDRLQTFPRQIVISSPSVRTSASNAATSTSVTPNAYPLNRSASLQTR
jgi:hypothetical protein